MTCPICGLGALTDGTTTFAADVEATVVVIRNVPATVCDVCGEAFIADDVSAELEAVVADSTRPGSESVVRHCEPAPA